jgi:acetyl-CoA C-acetyltransferase
VNTLIFDAVRTPRGRGRSDGALNEVAPVEVAATTLRAVAKRNHLPTDAVEDVVLGIVEPIAEQGGNLARIAALHAGLGEGVAGMQLNRYCASGLEAVATAAMRVASGQADLTIGGGVECMSRVKMTQSGMPMGLDPHLAIPHYIVPQGISADLMASKYGYTRADVDDYALHSQKRASVAWANNYFQRGVVPVVDDNGLVILQHDEMVRHDASLDALSSLRPSFEMMGVMAGMDGVVQQKHPEVAKIHHVHTAGNSSGIVDGSAAVLLGNQAAAQRHNLKPRAVLRGVCAVGSEPCIMLTGPEVASQKLLKRLGMSIGDMDLIELNEAFSAVVLRFMHAMNADHSKVNVNGGAIAMGHPLGATGAMILGVLLDELERRDLTLGLATLCVGGGMGIAAVIERVSA